MFHELLSREKATYRFKNVIIEYLFTKLKESSSWSNYLMLKAALSTPENIDIIKFFKLDLCFSKTLL